MSSVKSGTALVELLVALALMGVVSSIALATLQSSARWYERAALETDRAAQLTAATQVTTSLLQSASTRDGDLLAVGDSAVTWRATIGAGTVCNAAGPSLVASREHLTKGGTSFALQTAPQVGDLVAVFDDGPLPGTTDDRWLMYTLSSLSTIAGGCVGGPLADSTRDISKLSWRFSVTPSPATSSIGLPIRILRPTKLQLYRSGSEWSLGFSETSAGGGWSGTQPAAGPLASAARRGAGFSMYWIDTLGSPASAGPAGVRVSIRAPTAAAFRSDRGLRRSTDSVLTFLAFRNR